MRLCYPVSNTVRSVSLGTVLGLESCFVFAVCAFMNKASIILKIIQQKYQFKKNNYPVCELGTVLLFNRF